MYERTLREGLKRNRELEAARQLPDDESAAEREAFRSRPLNVLNGVLRELTRLWGRPRA